MKVLRVILIVLLLFPQVLRAQTSFDPGEGCLNVVEVTAGPELGTLGDRLIGANYLHERFINEQFSVGAGAGYSYHQQYQFSALPVYFSHIISSRTVGSLRLSISRRAFIGCWEQRISIQIRSIPLPEISPVSACLFHQAPASRFISLRTSA